MTSHLYTIIRLALGGVFLFSGAAKIMAPITFATLINAYGILPEDTTLPFAVLLAGFEIIAGMGLIFDIKGSLASVSGLLVMFIAVLGYGIHMGLDIDCGCFGPDEPEAAAFHGLRTALYRDIAMIGGVVFLYVYRFLKTVEPKSILIVYQHILNKGETEHEVT